MWLILEITFYYSTIGITFLFLLLHSLFKVKIAVPKNCGLSLGSDKAKIERFDSSINNSSMSNLIESEDEVSIVSANEEYDNPNANNPMIMFWDEENIS